MSEWRPIGTAPKDGTWILGCNDRGNRAVVLWSTNALHRRVWPVGDKNMNLHEQFTVGEGWIFPFTHGEVSVFWEEPRVKYWMPLPDPPK